ncbi:PREDICTED: gem-associated protein 4-like [Branchiostoma belcheri]|uniref:Gem-associated protein 4-like n=1 Tax=Branchiostoma belcheri TaxID=7741 RepID=A0A6P4ZPH2_BRABE|nr:PREDICTED: gem-associated protein 4-like [Branchiostoma belcheri]
MVYTHEIAVLHSAFVLAEQQSHTPLHDLDKPSAKVTASQLRPTCQEIVSGLEMAHKQFQQDHWSYKLTAILLEKVLDGKQAKPDSYFYPICSVLPRIGKTLYFELIKSLKWGKWFVQCLRQVPCPVATSLLTDLFTHVQLDPDEQDLSIITTICQSLLTPSLSDQSPSNQECLHQSGGSISSEGLQQTEAGLITVFFQEVDNLIPFFGKGEQRLKLVSSCILYTCGKLRKWKPTDLSVEDRNITQQIPSKCEQLRRMLPTDSQFLTDRKKLKKLVSRIDKMELRDSPTIHDEDIDRETSAESCVIVVEFLHKVLIKFHWLDNLDSDVLGSELVQVAITQSSVDCLVSICERGEEDSTTTRLYSFIRELCDMLQPCVVRWNKSIPSYAAMETVAKEIRVEKDGIHIQTALQKMNEKLNGYEECLDWMLNNSQELYKDPRWIDALERNVDILSSSRIVLSIAEIISTLRRQDSAGTEVLETLRKVLTAAYAQLPLHSQNTVLLQVMTIYGTGLLCSGLYQVEVEGDIITAFNRMVLLGEGQGGVEVFSTMCGAALQAPLLFLKTAVNQAVNNTGQAGVMSKLLQVLPSLCTYTPGPDSPALLCTTLRAAAGDLRPNTREENNLLGFVENLLQPYKPLFDVTCPFLCEPLLSAPDFASLAVFSYLSQHFSHQEQQLPLITALKLLQVVLQQQGQHRFRD